MGHPDLTSSSTNQDPDVTPTQDEQQIGSSQLPTTGSATADRKSSLTSNSTAPADHPTSSMVGSTSLNNTLLVFEKLDKLEMVQQELKKKVAQNSTFTGVNDISSPVKIAIRSPI